MRPKSGCASSSFAGGCLASLTVAFAAVGTCCLVTVPSTRDPVGKDVVAFFGNAAGIAAAVCALLLLIVWKMRR